MKSETFFYTTPDGAKIFTYRWLPDSQSDIKAVVQIVHGMAEHAARYERFATALVGAGYAVYASDLRGHGKTAGSLENVGYFADEKRLETVVDDLHTLTGIIKKENPKLPVFLFGHSMGSFFARYYAMLFGNDIVGLVLSGTGGDPGFAGKIGLFIGKQEVKKKGKKAKSPKMHKLFFGKYNKAFKPNRTEFDWLSRDTAEVDKYINDPFCGFISSASLYCDIIEILFFINNPKNVAKIHKNLPIYLFSGTLCPVGAKTKGVLRSYNDFVKAGIKDVTYKFYPDGRHEMLNEVNRQEVFKDVITWLDKHR